jgi:hypothetical protein
LAQTNFQAAQFKSPQPGSFRDEKLIQRALQDNVDLKVSPTDFVRIPSTISWNPEAKRDLFTRFQEIREEIVDYIPAQTLGRLPGFFGGKDLELFWRRKNFSTRISGQMKSSRKACAG